MTIMMQDAVQHGAEWPALVMPFFRGLPDQALGIRPGVAAWKHRS